MMVDEALLIIRVWLGVTFVLHGSQKLFGWFGGGGIPGTARFFEDLGIRPGRFWAVLAGLGEFGGGILIGLGYLTQLAALAIIITMIVAIAAVAGRRGFWSDKGGYEYNLLIIAVSFALMLSGPGAYALDSTRVVLGP
jgi:putative oxidoreductase